MRPISPGHRANIGNALLSFAISLRRSGAASSAGEWIYFGRTPQMPWLGLLIGLVLIGLAGGVGCSRR